MSNIVLASFDIGDYGLIVNGNPDYEAWYRIGRKLWSEKQKIQWNIGDWIVYGQEHYSDIYEQALDETDYTLQTLYNYASVARRIPIDQRRETIKFSMYQEVAPLDEDIREQVLDGVEAGTQNRETIRELRRQLKREQSTASVKVLPEPVNPQPVQPFGAVTIKPQLIMTKDGRWRYAFPDDLPLWIFESEITIYLNRAKAS